MDAIADFQRSLGVPFAETLQEYWLVILIALTLGCALWVVFASARDSDAGEGLDLTLSTDGDGGGDGGGGD